MARVSSGMLLSEAIRESGGFEKKLAAVIDTGEEAGCLEDMLKRLAENYEHEADLALTKLMNLLDLSLHLQIIQQISAWVSSCGSHKTMLLIPLNCPPRNSKRIAQFMECHDFIRHTDISPLFL